MSRTEDYLPLAIPMEAATNAQEVKDYEEKKAKVEAEGGKMKDEEKVRAIIPFQACLDEFCEAKMVRNNDCLAV